MEMYVFDILDQLPTHTRFTEGQIMVTSPMSTLYYK